MDPGVSGFNATWDFSSLVSIPDTTTEWIVDPATTTLGTFFPNANLCEKYSDGTFVYAHTTADSSLLVGYGDTINHYLITYYNPCLFALRPVTYGTSVNDSFMTHFSSSSLSFGGNGLVRINADAFGTLILPNGTYNNTLRIKITQSETDTSSSFTTFNNTVSYVWFDGAHTSALLKIDSTNAGTTISKSIQYLISESTEVHSPKTLKFSCYPNPTRDILHIAPCAKGTILITNTLGQLVATSQIDEQGLTLPTEQYPSGMYFLSYRTEQGTQTKQITILH
jgi:hypothetical protein